MEPEKDSLLSLEDPLLLASIFSTEVLIGIISIIILLLCSALISGSEVAFFSLTANDFEELENEDDPKIKTILKLKDQPQSLLATILISNNFINIAIVILSDYVLKALLPESTFATWADAIIKQFTFIGNLTTATQISNAIGFLITIVGVTFLLVLFGEVAPKFYAKLNNIKLAKFMASPLNFLNWLFTPISGILVGWTNIIEKRLHENTITSGLTSKEDIDEAIKLTVSNDSEIDQEADLLKSIITFGEISVKEIMRSRMDVVAVDFRISYPELLNVVRESGFSRIPVFDDDFDNVTGILYVKDLIGHLNDDNSFEWQSLIRTTVLFIPESKKIDDLLREFQRKRLHMAIVVDEYGGSSGIITLEDIMEEIIGEIKDEFDDEAEVIFKKIDENNYLFEGKTLINDFCKVMGLDSSIFDPIRGDSDSIAGIFLDNFGKLTKKDAEISYFDFFDVNLFYY
ncbi:MAG: gliding motility-associated protein GldE, partial [Bacteroidota bacterium]